MVALAAVFITQPLYNRLVNNIYGYSTSIEDKITEFTGLDVSYDSFSPSILSSFNIKGIRFSNSESENVVYIKNVKVNYKFSALFKKQFDEFVRNVSVNGVEISLSSLIDVINNMSFESNNNQVNFEEILSYIPNNVSFKNISLIYENEQLAASFGVKDIGIYNTIRNDAMEFQMEGNANVFLKDRNTKGTGEIYLNGTIPSDLNNSTLFISFGNLSDGTYSLNKLNLLATYKDKQVDVHTIQSVNPFSVQAQYNFDSKLISVKIDTEKLNPMSVVNFAGKSDVVKILKNIRCSISAEASMLADKDSALESLKYSSKGSVSLPSSIIPAGAVVSYDVSGDSNKVKLSKIGVQGPDCIVDGKLSFIFDSMQLDGTVNLSKFVLENGCEISTEIYFDHLDKGFMAFSPQIFIGDQALTALQAKVIPQNDSLDFELEVSDYSHLNASEPGVISLNGSYLIPSNFVQASVGFTSVYVQSGLLMAEQFIPSEQKEQLKKIETFIEPFMFTGEVFASTNFSSVSYNVPYLVMANTEQENQLLFLSVNGNNKTVQLDRFDLIYGKLGVNASIGLDFSAGNNATFYLDAVSSSIPYHLQGSFNDKYVKVAGDYGIDMELNLGKNNSMSGNAIIESLPISYQQYGVILSTDASFKYTKEDGPELQIVRFEVEENKAGSLGSGNPKLTLSGTGTKYGMQLKSISYTDTYSNLEGIADIALNINDNIFESVGLTANLRDISLSGEEISVDATVFNSELQPLNSKSIMNSLYISAMTEIKHFSLNRFMAVKNSNNEISATLSVSGTPENPYALINVQKVSFLLNNELVNADGSVILEDKDLSINNFAIKQSVWSVENINGSFSLENMIGKATAKFATAGQKNIIIPLELTLEDSYIPEGKFIPESMIIKLASTGLSGSLVKKTVPFDVTAIYSPDFISFYSSENLGVTGSFTKNDGLMAQLFVKDAAEASVIGIFEGNDMNISISGIRAELNKIISIFDVEDMIALKTGVLEGSLAMLGTYDTPEFAGLISVSDLNFGLPMFLEENVTSDTLIISAAGNEIEILDNTFKIGKNNEILTGAKVVMNKWALDNLTMHLATGNKKIIPLKLKTGGISATGDLTCNLNIELSDSILDLSGKISGERINFAASLKDLAGGNSDEKAVTKSSSKEMYIKTNLEVLLGTHVMLNVNPLLRCILVPNTRLVLNLDSTNNNYEIDGKLNIKSGDVAYVNRSFYIKEGSVKFNSSGELSNPQISLKAETREKDEKGENIRIILSAENQYLQDFKPRFTSIPSKSENEIYSLLGQVVIADLNDVGNKNPDGTTSDVMYGILATAGDYYIQSFATRKLENALRESLNFDIFSIRTNFLQYSANYMNNRNSGPNSISVGNFLDISTVYIGKYLGSSMYVDAMLNLAQDNRFEQGNGNWILQPEIGLEFEMPFTNKNWQNAQDLNANFRFGLAGDYIFGNNQTTIVPSLSMSLLWRF